MRRSIAVLVLLLACACRRESERRVTLVLTPRVPATGLATLLAEEFTKASGVAVIVETRAPESFSTRDFTKVPAAVLTDDRTVVDRLSSSTRLRTVIARDEFQIIGPASDPARVSEAKSAADAFARIASRQRAFCSAVDVASWRERELALWRAAKIDPAHNRRYRECHGDAARVVQDTAARNGYALIHASAALHARKASLAILAEGLPDLRTDYWMILVGGRKVPEAEEWFVQWSMSRGARELVSDHRIAGERRFAVP